MVQRTSLETPRLNGNAVWYSYAATGIVKRIEIKQPCLFRLKIQKKNNNNIIKYQYFIYLFMPYDVDQLIGHRR